MKMLSHSNHHQKRAGFALVLTLCVLTLITIMVIGFIITSRFDRVIAQGYANADRVTLVAESAVDHARALLATSIPEVGPNAPAVPVNWWCAPGRLWTQTGNDAPQIYNLYSGDATTAADGPDLNRRKIDGTYPIEPTGKPMRVKWINVGEDPGKPVSLTNPVVARFAYWIDVENTRVNLRYGKMSQGGKISLTPTRLPFINALPVSSFKGGSGFDGIAPGHPSCSDLAVLANANDILGTAFGGGGPLRLSEVSEFSEYFSNQTAWKNFYTANQFQISASGQSPEFSPFGVSRMTAGLEGRNKMFAGYQYYWDLENPSILPLGNFTLRNVPGDNTTTFYELDYVRASVRQLANAFLSTEWPGYAGTSLVAKWKARANMPAADSNKFAEQVAWNLQGLNTYQYREFADMISLGNVGRAAAGTNAQGLFVRNLMPSVLKTPTNGRYYPQNGVPYVTELGICVERAATPNAPMYISLVGELYVPPGIRSVDQADVRDKGITVGDPGINTGMYIIPTTVDLLVNGVRPSGIPLNPANPIDTSYKTAGRLTTSPGTGKMGGLDSTPTVNYLVLESSSGPTPATPDTRITVPVPGSPAGINFSDIRLKAIAIRSATNNNTIDANQLIVQYCPLYTSDPNAAGILYPSPQSDTISLDNFTYTPGSGKQYYTVEVSDPRRSALSDAWTTATTNGTAPRPGKNTLGAANANWSSGMPDIRTPARHSLAGAATPAGGAGYYPANPDAKNTSFYTPGFCAALWTAPPYVVPATGDCYLNLTKTDTALPPDYLVLELLNTTCGLSSGNMQGTVNINSGIFPGYFGIPPRTKAIEALLNRWSVGGTNVPAATIASTIAGRFNDPTFTGYPYRGAIIADLDFSETLPQLQRQSLIVTLAGRLATQGTDFGVWGVAQTVKQTETGEIIVQGERRFYSMVQAGPFTGVDGNLGNARVNATGSFIESIPYTDGKLYGSMRDSIDGPDAVPLPSHGNYVTPVDKSSPGSKLREAFNPLKPYMQYKTAYFKFLEP
ncbi:hypothetical protein DB346_15275 [Verrucomicrobia bacterium LW23]|nr:hypothetical protein DB346_15275 [Verrucomicrobia bacterium LW23]